MHLVKLKTFMTLFFVAIACAGSKVMADSKQNTASGTLYLHSILRGGIVNSPEIAIQFAHIVARSLYGDDEATRQEPFFAEDRYDRWIVRGSYNSDRRKEGPGPFFMTIMKTNCEVLDAHVDMIMHIPPEARAIIEDGIGNQPTTKPNQDK